MADITQLKKLREQTGVSFALCKKALEETGDDLEKAKKKLSEWGGEKIAEKATRATSAGGIFSYVHHNKKVAGLIEVRSETDFVSGNKEFQTFGQELAMQVATYPAENVQQFLQQEYIRDPKKKVSDLLKEAILKFGEHIALGRILRWNLGE